MEPSRAQCCLAQSRPCRTQRPPPAGPFCPLPVEVMSLSLLSPPCLLSGSLDPRCLPGLSVPICKVGVLAGWKLRACLELLGLVFRLPAPLPSVAACRDEESPSSRVAGAAAEGRPGPLDSRPNSLCLHFSPLLFEISFSEMRRGKNEAGFSPCPSLKNSRTTLSCQRAAGIRRPGLALRADRIHCSIDHFDGFGTAEFFQSWRKSLWGKNCFGNRL